MKKQETFNKTRQKALESFCTTLDELYNKEITEIAFKNKWYENLAKEADIIADGWYNPPERGMTVLFGNRVSFDSLRNEKNWSNHTEINWEKDLLYAYCSPIDKTTGMIGDISLTLYFGEDKKIRQHIKNCHKAVNEVFDALERVKNSQELFEISQQIFAKHKLKNCIISKTDNMPLDLGHTFPILEGLINQDKLTEQEKAQISKARKFINGDTNWDFTEGMQFTIEPQLVSTEDLNLPQISQHYLVKKYQEEFIVCKDIENILIEYNLIEG